jgi:spore maturation protein CgeB
MSEMNKKIVYFLVHDEERAAMAAAAREKVLKEHTWKHRAKSLLEAIA